MMEEYRQVFRRYEAKYLLSEAQYEAFSKRIADEIKPDQYHESAIANIYYDTPDDRLIRASLEKPVFKEKLRMRSYRTPEMDDEVFLEIKKKYRGVVYKRRAKMPLRAAERHMGLAHCRSAGTQIEREINWFIDSHAGLAPRMYISYERLAYAGLRDPEFRVTFDSNILWREEALSLRNGAWGAALLAPGQRLMELKIPEAMPLWFAHALDEFRIYPASFSKYGEAYRARCRQEKRGVVCA